MAVVVGTLAVVTLTGIVTPWILLGLAFALGTANAVNDPAWQAVVPDLLPKEELAAGVTLSGVRHQCRANPRSRFWRLRCGIGRPRYRLRARCTLVSWRRRG